MQKNIIKLNDVKTNNTLALLKLFLHRTEISRIEIAEELSCDNTTVTRAVRELINRKIIIQGTKKEQDHGRPRIMLKLNPEGPVFIGISLESDRINGVITDLRGTILQSERIIFADQLEKKIFLNQAAELSKRLQVQAGERLSGFGVSVFGSFSGDEFTFDKAAALPSLNGFKLLPFFQKHTAAKITVCDLLVGRMAFISRSYPQFNSGTVMLVSCGGGIGSLFAENGRLLFSRNNHGGELGHLISVPGGELCECGRRGCLETVASVKTLIKKCNMRSNKNYDFNEICELFAADDPIINEEVNSIAAYLGTAISNQLNTCPVDRLIITGRTINLGKKFQQLLTENINNLLFSFVKNHLQIDFIPSDKDNDAAIGAAVLSADLTELLR